MSFDGDAYQQRFDELARRGVEVHGEAHFVRALAPSSVLDAGCGTGRVAIELARHGIEVVGVDRDTSMLAAARKRDLGIDFVDGDLANVVLGRRFQLVLMAGNVPLFADNGSTGQIVSTCAAHLEEDGHLVAGFQLQHGYSLDNYDVECAASGLVLVDRFSSWERAPWLPTSAYAVSVHQKLDARSQQNKERMD